MDERPTQELAKHQVSRVDFSKKSAFQKFVASLFGFDFFISYRWSDGRDYAVELAESLEAGIGENKYRCFLDSDDFAKGDDWKQQGKDALERTSILIVVGSPGALDSQPVLDEVREFTRRKNRVIPIEFVDADGNRTLDPLYKTSKLHPYIRPEILRISESLTYRDDAPSQLAGPADDVVNQIAGSFDLITQQDKRTRVLGVAAVVFAMVALLAIVFWRFSAANFAEANRQRTRAQDEQRKAVVELVEADAQRADDRLKQGRRDDAIDLLIGVGELIRKHDIVAAEAPGFRPVSTRALLHLPEIYLSGRTGFYVTVATPSRRIIGSEGWRESHVPVWDFDGRHLGDLTHRGHPLMGITVNHLAGRLYTLSPGDGLLRVWNAQTLEQISEYEFNVPSGFSSFDYFPRLDSLVLTADDKRFILDFETTTLLPLHASWEPLLFPPTYAPDRDRLYELAKSSDLGVDVTNRTLVVVAPRRLADFNDRAPVAVTGKNDGLIRVWDVKDYSLRRAMPFPDRVYNLLLSPRADLAVAVGERGYLELLNLHSGRPVAIYPDLVSDPSNVENFDFDGRALNISDDSATRLVQVMPHVSPAAFVIENVQCARSDRSNLLLTRIKGGIGTSLAVYHPGIRQIVREVTVGKSIDEWIKRADGGTTRMTIPLRYFDETDSLLYWTQDAIYEITLPGNVDLGSLAPRVVSPTDQESIGLTSSFPTVSPMPGVLCVRNGGKLRLLQRTVKDGDSVWSEFPAGSLARLPDDVRQIIPVESPSLDKWLFASRTRVFQFDAARDRLTVLSEQPDGLRIFQTGAGTILIQVFAEQASDAKVYHYDPVGAKLSRASSGVIVNWKTANKYLITYKGNDELSIVRTSDSAQVGRIDIGGLGELRLMLPGTYAWSTDEEDSLSGHEGLFSGARNAYADGLRISVSESAGVIVGSTRQHLLVWDLPSGKLRSKAEAFSTRQNLGRLYRTLVDPSGRFMATLEGNLNRVTVRSLQDSAPLYSLPLQAPVRYGFGDGHGNYFIAEGYKPPHRLLHIGREVTDILKLGERELIDQLVAVRDKRINYENAARIKREHAVRIKAEQDEQADSE